MTWTMRRLSAITKGRSGSRLMRTLYLPPALRKVFLASSTNLDTDAGSGLTDSESV